MGSSSGGRDEILRRLRLVDHGSAAHGAEEHGTAAVTILPEYTPGQVFADLLAGGIDELFEQFSRKLTALKGEVFRVRAVPEAAEVVARLVREGNFQRCGRHPAPLLDAVFRQNPELLTLDRSMEQQLVARSGDGQSRTSMGGLAHTDVEQMECAFTVADALIARTGSVVLRSVSAGGRRLSVLPPVHCVIATSAQLHPSLGGWLSQSRADRSWSFGTIITGPSRTADIERILVMGAHGPKRLVVIVIDEP